ncbi:MAG: SlyX family protein [Desulfovibrio sp.]|nr:SlyX family protein [Desulfovibrio sp.]
MRDSNARLDRLEELTFFQEERIAALDTALAAQQRQLDKVERELAMALASIRRLRDQLRDVPENTLPPHYMPERW